MNPNAKLIKIFLNIINIIRSTACSGYGSDKNFCNPILNAFSYVPFSLEWQGPFKKQFYVVNFSQLL